LLFALKIGVIAILLSTHISPEKAEAITIPLTIWWKAGHSRLLEMDANQQVTTRRKRHFSV